MLPLERRLLEPARMYDSLPLQLSEDWSIFFGDFRHFPFVFPMGGVPKPHEPSVIRPTSDHTKTGFNEHTVLGILKHSLDAYNQVCWCLKQGFCMYVSDVQDAFLLIPLAPWVWFFMFFRWFGDAESNTDDCISAKFMTGYYLTYVR